MRLALAIAISALGVATAQAADLPNTGAERSVFARQPVVGQRVGPIVIYDYQPGVIVRAYWREPWRNRHYYPFGGNKIDPDLVPANDTPPEPAENFERHWSTSQSFIRELPSANDRVPAPAPRAEQPSQNQDAAKP